MQGELRLWQLADSALPIGSAAHSWGLETLVADGRLGPDTLGTFLEAYLEEAGALEASICRTAYGLAHSDVEPAWSALNRRLSAQRPARESRTASVTLGRRLLQLVLDMEDWPCLRTALEAPETHHCAAFGLVGGVLGVGLERVVLAYLQQSVTTLISACQRLMPVGQRRATRLLWQVQPGLLRAAQCRGAEAPCFTPLLDVASMRHPRLTTRLFIS